MDEKLEDTPTNDRDRITFAVTTKPSRGPLTKPFRKFSSFSRHDTSSSADGPPIRKRTSSFFRRASTTESFDEGFDAPREGDFRKKQEFYGWKLLL
jgi:hypothetical protein